MKIVSLCTASRFVPVDYIQFNPQHIIFCLTLGQNSCVTLHQRASNIGAMDEMRQFGNYYFFAQCKIRIPMLNQCCHK